jgi:hypothetical protein
VSDSCPFVQGVFARKVAENRGAQELSYGLIQEQ